MSPVRDRVRRVVRPPYGASLGALLLAGACVAGVIALHLRRPDLDPLHHVLSEYANGPFGVIMTAVFSGVGAACIALGWRSPLADGMSWTGMAQRVLAGTVVVWLALTARRVRTLAFGGR